MSSIIGEGEQLRGIQLPIQSKSPTFAQPWEAQAGPGDLARIAAAADESRLGYVAVCDHVAVPTDVDISSTWYDTVATLAWLGARCPNLWLLSHVYVLAYRHPLVAAKGFATLDALTGGRAIMGVGAGHVRGEFEALDADFDGRGPALEEAIGVLRDVATVMADYMANIQMIQQSIIASGPNAGRASIYLEFNECGNHGDMVACLHPQRAPETVNNFVNLARYHYYDGLTFHRVIDGFMIQGGGFEPGMKQKPTRAPIDSEAKNGLKNAAGTLAMARTQDPHSASAQFFINLVDNRPLDYPSRDGWGYAVFGKVSQGFDIVQKIAKVKTGNAGFHQNVPVDPVIIESARLLPAAQPAK